MIWAAASGIGSEWWWLNATVASRAVGNMREAVEATGGGRYLNEAARGRGIRMAQGLRQVVGLKSGGGGEHGHQEMDIMCRRWLRRQVEGNI